MNKKGIKHIIIFVLVTLGLHALFRILNWPGSRMFLVYIPFLFGLYYVIKSVLFLIKAKFRQAGFSFLITLLFFLISLKLDYEYYNIFISILLIIFGLIVIRPINKLLTDKRKTISFLLITINFVLLLVPDNWILAYLNYNKSTWTSNITWDQFKGDPIEKSSHSAMIETGFRWKINKAYNYPPALLLTMITQDSSWKKPLKNQKSSSILLQHEQGHFDITESYGRMALDSIDKMWGRNPEEIEDVIKNFANARDSLQKEYDSLTIHGKNITAQDSLTKLIKERMKK